MPCRYDPPYESSKQMESKKVLHGLAELGYHASLDDYPDGHVSTLDIDTAALCELLKNKTPAAISNLSLELQIWWRDHQAADRIRSQEERIQTHRNILRKNGLAKLTPEEKEALGL